MSTLSEQRAADAALRYPGTLLTPGRELVAPYDLEQADHVPPGLRAASHGGTGILNAAEQPFRLDWAAQSTVHVINGMGVALGDSIIGLAALAALRAAHPRLRFVLYRPATAPGYVEALYTLAAATIAPVRTLPFPVDALPAGETRIDVGNQVYRPAFARLPMIDYFLDALGAEPASIAAEARRNRWLAAIALPALPEPWATQRYALLCADASTPLRSLPAAARHALVGRIAERYGLPVVGFGPLDHPAYTDVGAQSRGTAQFLAWIRGASVLVSVDTAALHAADGFDVPTLACFTSIAPELRVRDYPHCVPVTLALPEAVRNRHASDAPEHLALVADAYRALDWDALAWPQARP